MAIRRASWVFLFFALVFGTLFLVLLPPFQAPDEPFHFLRAYQVSTGTWGETGKEGQKGAWVPASLLEFLSAFDHVPLRSQVKVDAESILRFRARPLDAGNLQFIPYATALPHPPLPYLPQALGGGIGRGLDLSPFHLFYLGRALNLLAWIALVFAAIRLTPIYPWLLALLALTPMSLQQAASLSPDAVTHGMAFFFFATLMRLALAEAETVPASRLWPAALSGLGLTLSKLAYAGHALFFALIPSRNLRFRKIFWGVLPALILANAAIAYALLRGGLSSGPLGQSRIETLLLDPYGFAEILGNTFRVYGLAYLEQFLGTLGHLDTPLPTPLLVYQAALLLAFSLLERAPGRGLSSARKAWIFLVLLLEVLAIWTGLYLTWMEEGSGLIRGGQGRYLIPLAPFFFLLLYRPRRENSPGLSRRWEAVAIYSLLMILSLSLYYLWRRFYVVA